jgi:hypothetical protein
MKFVSGFVKRLIFAWRSKSQRCAYCGTARPEAELARLQGFWLCKDNGECSDGTSERQAW